MDGEDCSRQSTCISTIPGGHSKGREHMYSTYGSRAMQGAIAEGAEALPATFSVKQSVVRIYSGDGQFFSRYRIEVRF